MAFKLRMQDSTIQQRKVINNDIRNIRITNHSMLIMNHLVKNPGIVELPSLFEEKGNSTASLQYDHEHPMGRDGLSKVLYPECPPKIIILRNFISKTPVKEK